MDIVYTNLDQAAKQARQVADHGRELFQTDRADFVRESDGTALFERDAFSFQAAKRLASLDAEHDGLVFGRLDDVTDETRYIGRIGVRDPDYEPLVIDWRARAAEPFYRATAMNPMGVVRRRVLRCRGDRVVGIEDDLLDESAGGDLAVVGEGALMASLKRARGHTMKDIVATIQAEQDDAIRAPYQGFTFIAGGPGTGKTVVALHRIAFLLYTNRARFERGGVLVVGPSPVFMNYIDRVLPSLGEDSVTLRSIGAVADDVLGGMRAVRVDAPAVAAVKGSLRMVDVLKALAALPLVEPPPLRVSVKGNVQTLRPEPLHRIRLSVLAKHKANQGAEAARAAVVAALYRQVPPELELTEDDYADMIDTEPFRAALDAWWPVLHPTDVLARLADPAVVARAADKVLSPAEQQALGSGFAGLSDPATHDWTVADTALLDELAAILGPVPAAEPTLFLDALADEHAVVTTADKLSRTVQTDPDAEPHETYAHVLVDEAQDVTPMQWRMLRRRGARASWTIVGDPAQSSWPSQSEADQALAQLIGTAPSREFRLTTNYRSPAEVFNLAAAVVRSVYPSAELPHAIRSTGVLPQLAQAGHTDWNAGLTGLIESVAERVEGTIGVIAPPSRSAAVRAIAERLDHLGDRLVVLTPLEAKGLEYDAVIVVSPDEVVSESPGGVRLLYVALTRPTQVLVTLDIGGTGAWRDPLTAELGVSA